MGLWERGWGKVAGAFPHLSPEKAYDGGRELTIFSNYGMEMQLNLRATCD